MQMAGSRCGSGKCKEGAGGELHPEDFFFAQKALRLKKKKTSAFKSTSSGVALSIEWIVNYRSIIPTRRD